MKPLGEETPEKPCVNSIVNRDTFVSLHDWHAGHCLTFVFSALTLMENVFRFAGRRPPTEPAH